MRNKHELSTEDLDFIRSMCKTSEKIGFSWAEGIRLFPAVTKDEVLWKKKMLEGIRICKKQDGRQTRTRRKGCSDLLQTQPCAYA
jgi:hypothetical protein